MHSIKIRCNEADWKPIQELLSKVLTPALSRRFATTYNMWPVGTWEETATKSGLQRPGIVKALVLENGGCVPLKELPNDLRAQTSEVDSREALLAEVAALQVQLSDSAHACDRRVAGAAQLDVDAHRYARVGAVLPSGGDGAPQFAQGGSRRSSPAGGDVGTVPVGPLGQRQPRVHDGGG